MKLFGGYLVFLIVVISILDMQTQKVSSKLASKLIFTEIYQKFKSSSRFLLIHLLEFAERLACVLVQAPRSRNSIL